MHHRTHSSVRSCIKEFRDFSSSINPSSPSIYMLQKAERFRVFSAAESDSSEEVIRGGRKPQRRQRLMKRQQERRKRLKKSWCR